MDSTTFGGSPASLSLAKILEQSNSTTLIRRVSSKLVTLCTRLKEVNDSTLSEHTKRWACDRTWEDFKKSISKIEHAKAKDHALNVGKMHYQEYKKKIAS